MTKNTNNSKHEKAKKTAENNQWTNPSLDQESLPRNRQDGPGGN